MQVEIKKVPVQVLADTMQRIWETPAKDMVWYRGRILITSLPSKNLAF